MLLFLLSLYILSINNSFTFQNETMEPTVNISSISSILWRNVKARRKILFAFLEKSLNFKTNMGLLSMYPSVITSCFSLVSPMLFELKEK